MKTLFALVITLPILIPLLLVHTVTYWLARVLNLVSGTTSDVAIPIIDWLDSTTPFQ